MAITRWIGFHKLLTIRSAAIVIIAVTLIFQRTSNAFAEPQLTVTTTAIEGVLYRGSYVDFQVYATNFGPGNVSNPDVTITTSDPTNVPITSTNSRSWYNYYLPPNGTEYDLGEFAFSVSHNAPDGSYIMRIEIDYESQGTALQKVITQQFNVQQSPQELAAQQARTFQILVTASIVIIVSSVLAILIHRRRNQESHH